MPVDPPPPSSPSPPTKERLLSIALTLLREKGVGALTIRNIASRAGVSVSVVHHHYINKQGLLDACKMHFYQNLGTVITAALPEVLGKPVDVILDHMLRILWAHARDNTMVLRLLASEVLASGQLIDGVNQASDRPFMALAISHLAPIVGLQQHVLRVRLQAVFVLVSRFAISSDSELRSVLGTQPENTADDTEATIQNHLVEMAKLLLISSPREAANDANTDDNTDDNDANTDDNNNASEPVNNI